MPELFKMPNVLDCKYFVSESTDLETSRRIVLDYELDYNLTGGRTIYVNGKQFELAPDSIVFRKPGELAESFGPYNMYTLTLNFSDTIPSDYIPRRLCRNPSIVRQPSEPNMWSCIPTYSRPEHIREIREFYRRILRVYGQPDRRAECEALALKLLCQLAADSIGNDLELGAKENKLDSIIEFISEHYSEVITLDMLSDMAGLNKSYLTRIFKRKTGYTPIDYLIKIRLACAQDLLVNTSLTVTKISVACGFSNPSYFISHFREKVGMTPERYRKTFAMMST